MGIQTGRVDDSMGGATISAPRFERAWSQSRDEPYDRWDELTAFEKLQHIWNRNPELPNSWGGPLRTFDEQKEKLASVLLMFVGGAGCFEAETLVITDDGFVEIQDVRSGDLVWSYDETTGEVDLREVVVVSARETGLVVHVHIVGGDRISTTNEHPFWVDGVGWRNAGEIAAGDTLLRLDSGTVQVEYIEVERRHTTVYNLEIEGYGTYFVAEPEVLVHNSRISAARGAAPEMSRLLGNAPRSSAMGHSPMSGGRSRSTPTSSENLETFCRNWAAQPM